MPEPIPQAVTRRIILALLGYRCRGGVWAGPTGRLLTEEEVDAMPEPRWRAFVRRWLTSAVALH
jgi:hypothetical protein